MNMLAINDPKFSITPTGIQFSEELSFDEWDSLGQKLAPLGRSIGFIIGDWINYGEGRYGEKYGSSVEFVWMLGAAATPGARSSPPSSGRAA